MESFHVRIDRVTQGAEGQEHAAERQAIDSQDFLWIHVEAELPSSAAPEGEYLRIVDGKPDPGTRVRLDPPHKIGGYYRFSVIHYTLAAETAYAFHFADRLTQPRYGDSWEIATIPVNPDTRLIDSGEGRQADAQPALPRSLDVDFRVEIEQARIELRISRAGSNAVLANQFQDATPESLRNALRFASAMERIAPPRPRFDRDAPAKGAAVANPPADPADPVTLKAVSQYWTNKCAGGDTYDNNCAHYLSDAMLRCGFVELKPPADCINARCSAKRPVRARDMWCWFKSKATKTSTTPTKNTGAWAVFQLDEQQYWGGHVVLLDSDEWKYYGTQWYPDWDQYLYQW